MNSYSFIEDLFRNVLTQSKTIAGRFYVCPKGGGEINTDQLEQVIKDTVRPVEGKTYPLSLMLPPTSEMNLKDTTGEWERYRIEMFFLTTSFYLNGQTKLENKSTGTSQQAIPKDWDEMKQCAKDFILQLTLIGAGRLPSEYPLRLVDNEKKYFDPVTLQGNDGASGVRLVFKVDVWQGCIIEDYEADSWQEVVIPNY